MAPLLSLNPQWCSASCAICPSIDVYTGGLFADNSLIQLYLFPDTVFDLCPLFDCVLRLVVVFSFEIKKFFYESINACTTVIAGEVQQLRSTFI